MKSPQLTLRDLFWLVLVIGIATAWWVSDHRLRSTNERLAHEKEELAHQNAMRTAEVSTLNETFDSVMDLLAKANPEQREAALRKFTAGKGKASLREAARGNNLD